MADDIRTFDTVDVSRSEIEATYGTPSVVIEDRVLCCAAEDPDACWVFVDAWPHDVCRYSRQKQRDDVFLRDEDPLVRTIRVGGVSFRERLILTAFGSFLRWGPGWMIDHPPPSATDEQLAICSQLRQIERDDPSS